MSEALNPDAKELGPLDREILDALVDDYDKRLTELGVVGAELAADALNEYFDEKRFERYRKGESIPERSIVVGARFSRNSTIESHGWVVRTRFSSSDYPILDGHLEAMFSLKEERTKAVQEYIAKLR